MHACMHACNLKAPMARARGIRPVGGLAMRRDSTDPEVGSHSDKIRRGGEHLVTVEAQREFDLFSGEWAERVFVKLYVAARTSGLLASISDRDWKTLCTLATYMDGESF